MKYLGSSAAFALLFAQPILAGTRIWSVWVNGVDTGTGFGIRQEIHDGYCPDFVPRVGGGISTWPFKNVSSIDYRCQVLGDHQNPNTIDASPGDILTFEWHDNNRTAADDILTPSTDAGPCLVYLSPDPPAAKSWVKIFQETIDSNGAWCSTGNVAMHGGKLNVRLPTGLAAGKYLIRPEIIGLSGLTVPSTGPDLYFECVQLNVLGTGSVPLPTGISIPGDIAPNDPGLLYNIYSAETPYTAPGGTVWSGAAPSPTAPAFGTTKGLTTEAAWATWVPGTVTTLTVTQYSATLFKTGTVTPSWSTTYHTPAATAT
ncbi:hypothetical protein FRB97_009322 [Tulasnella sp. 331]|nr:hypothetical protein FRB97_009322 [Tulasnella sp. 331]